MRLTLSPYRPFGIALAIVILFAACHEHGWAQATVDTFYVTMVRKTPTNPYYGRGDTMAYAIDGVEAKELTLLRLKKYVFKIGDVPDDRYFMITRTPVGEGRDEYNRGVVGQGAIRNQFLTFTPSKDSPDLLCYQDGEVTYAGGRINVVDSLTSGIDNRSAPAISEAPVKAFVRPDPMNSVGAILCSARRGGSLTIELVDVLGSTVAVHEAGTFDAGPVALPLDVTQLANGAYAYRVFDEERTIVASGLVRVLH
jgi:hypothetical protein